VVAAVLVVVAVVGEEEQEVDEAAFRVAVEADRLEEAGGAFRRNTIKVKRVCLKYCYIAFIYIISSNLSHEGDSITHHQ
jgi:hypothetical protein